MVWTTKMSSSFRCVNLTYRDSQLSTTSKNQLTEVRLFSGLSLKTGKASCRASVRPDDSRRPHSLLPPAQVCPA